MGKKTMWIIGIIIILGLVIGGILLFGGKSWNLIQDDTGTLFCLQRGPVDRFEVKISSHNEQTDCLNTCVSYAKNREFITCGELGGEKESVCESSGGTWRQLGDSCADSCLRFQGDIACSQVLTMGCDCGTFKCTNLNGECIPNTQ